MIEKIVFLATLMLLPFIELRFAIPVGILSISMSLPFGISLSGFGLSPLIVFPLAIIMGSLLAFTWFNLLHLLDEPLKKSRFSKRYFRILEKAQKRIHPYIEKYGVLGLAIYIALPIPGSGVYIGSFGGYVLGFERKQFYKAAIIGVTIASFIMTALATLGNMII